MENKSLQLTLNLRDILNIGTITLAEIKSLIHYLHFFSNIMLLEQFISVCEK
jgi:hypothetical protein